MDRIGNKKERRQQNMIFMRVILIKIDENREKNIDCNYNSCVFKYYGKRFL
jgi:hypothetical protein